MNKTDLLSKLTTDRDERILLARVLDQIQLAQRKNIPTHTPFLSPREISLTTQLIAVSGHPRHLFTGGYPGAERQICAFLPDWQEETDDVCPDLCALRATWYAEETLSHRDFLGALMGMGISREKVGDILVGAGTCDILLLEEIKPYLLQSMTTAGRSHIHLTEIGLEEITPPPVEVQERRDTVNSLRLDAVGATGFATSRSKMSDYISAGRVSLNGLECTKPDHPVAQGDTLACRGLGKCRLKTVGGESRKGRIMIVMERYL